MNQARTRLFAGMLMLATILLIWNHSATAAMQAAGQSIEVATADLSLWQLRAGVLAVRKCPTCDLRLLRVDQNTDFVVKGKLYDGDPNDPDAKRDFFLQHAREPAGRKGMVGLFVELDSDTIRTIRLSPRRGE